MTPVLEMTNQVTADLIRAYGLVLSLSVSPINNSSVQSSFHCSPLKAGVVLIIACWAVCAALKSLSELKTGRDTFIAGPGL